MKDFETVMEEHRGLVMGVAKPFIHPAADPDEVIADACIGLWKAREKYNPKRGKFSTYATWWIASAIA